MLSVLPDNAETLSAKHSQTSIFYHLDYILGNISAKNCYNWTVLRKVTAKCWDSFFEDTV